MTMQNPQTCLSAELLRQLSQDELSPAELQDVEDHVSDCERCRQLLEVPQFDQQWRDEIVPILRTPLESPHVAGDQDDRDREGESLDSILRLLGPTDDPHMLGRIGSYEVVGVIGRGGMGVVFKAYEGALNRFVAIKMLLPHLAASGAARKRFAREGQAAAAVIDDNVMPIYSVAEWQGVPYLVTQYSRGATLQKRIQDQGPLELKEILRIGMQTARGLAAAHAQGLVHRDVKPSNILLDGTVERALLTDFGLARAVDDASITRTGIIAGTPQYMSPEQARGGSVDARSDLFGLGCVLYAMCTGRPPFRADSSYAILRMITDDEPRSIREINPDIPEWLCWLISRLMAKSPDARFGNALEVAVLLEQCLAHVQQPTSAPLPASLVPHTTGRRSIFNSTRIGVIAMLGTIGMILLGTLFSLATEAPDISGEWTSDEWGTVVLESTGSGKYKGTFSGAAEGQPAKGDNGFTGGGSRGEPTLPWAGGMMPRPSASNGHARAFYSEYQRLGGVMPDPIVGNDKTGKPTTGNLPPEKEPFTAWGKEVGGLQAGLGLDYGNRRTYGHGEVITLVVRLRNVGKEAVKFRYLRQDLYENLAVTDADGEAVPQCNTKFMPPNDPESENLEPGKEIVLKTRMHGSNGVPFVLIPSNSEDLKLDENFRPLVVGIGKVQLQIEKVFGTYSFDFPKLSTGTLELEVNNQPGGPGISGSSSEILPGAPRASGVPPRSNNGESGTLHLKWSRVERRFNGTWGVGAARRGTMSLRLVDKEIRGGFTTDEDVQLETGTPLLGDLLWTRSVATAPVPFSDPSTVPRDPESERVQLKIPPGEILVDVYAGRGLWNSKDKEIDKLLNSINLLRGVAVQVHEDGKGDAFTKAEVHDPVPVRAEPAETQKREEWIRRIKIAIDEALRAHKVPNIRWLDCVGKQQDGPASKKPEIDNAYTARIIVEAWVTAVIAKDVKTASSMAKHLPARADQIEGWGNRWKLSDFSIGTVKTDEESSPPRALVVSAKEVPVTLPVEGQPAASFLVFELKLMNDGWSIIDVEPWGTVEQAVDHFLNGDPDAPRPMPEHTATGTRLSTPAVEMQERLQGTWDVTVFDTGDGQINRQTYQAVIREQLLGLQAVDQGKVLGVSPWKLTWPDGNRPDEVDVIWDPNGDARIALGRIVCDDSSFQLAIRAEKDSDGTAERPSEISAGQGFWYIECTQKAKGETAKSPTGLSKAATADPAVQPQHGMSTATFGQSQRTLSVSQVLKEGRTLDESGEVVVVRFRVATARASERILDTKNDIREALWILSSEPTPYEDHPLAFRVYIMTKALDELKKNGVEDIAKHFVGKILEVEGPVGMVLDPEPLLQTLRFQLGDLPNEQVEVASYSTDVYSVDQIQEAKADSLPSNDGAKTLDQKNLRRVIEVYVAAALQGDHTTAASVAILQGKPADPKQIEPLIQAISRSLNLKQLAMHSIYLNDWEHPTGALAISESVTHAEKQRNGERAGFVMLELKRIEEDWFVIGVEFRTKDAADEKLTLFLNANPKSIDLPPLTPNSLPQRNSAEPVGDIPKEASENNEKPPVQDTSEASPEKQPLDSKNTPAEADGGGNSAPVPAQDAPEEQSNESRETSNRKEAVDIQAQQVLDRWRKHSESIETLAVEWKQTANYSAGSLEGKELLRIDDGGHSFPEKTTEVTHHCRVVIKGGKWRYETMGEQWNSEIEQFAATEDIATCDGAYCVSFVGTDAPDLKSPGQAFVYHSVDTPSRARLPQAAPVFMLARPFQAPIGSLLQWGDSTPTVRSGEDDHTIDLAYQIPGQPRDVEVLYRVNSDRPWQLKRLSYPRIELDVDYGVDTDQAPTGWTCTERNPDGTICTIITAKVTSWAMNAPVDDGEFTIKLPPGTKVWDRTGLSDVSKYWEAGSDSEPASDTIKRAFAVPDNDSSPQTPAS